MSKLDEIKAAIAKYDKAKVTYDKAARRVVRGYPTLEDRITEDTWYGCQHDMGKNAPDYLRLLLPVVEAARLVIPKDPSHVITTIEEDVAARNAWIALAKALKALD